MTGLTARCRLADLAHIVLLTLFLLGAVEFTAALIRMVVEAPAARAGPAPEVSGPAFVAENLAWRNVELFTMRPGLVHGSEYRMDSYGLRIHQLTGPRHDAAAVDIRMDRHDALDCRKIWLFGGSTVMGLGLAEQHSLPAQLQDRLNVGAVRAGGAERWCVFNLGMGSQESAQELLLFYELLLRGHLPDLVVFYDGINETMGRGAGPIWDTDSEPIRTMRSASVLRRWRAAVGQNSGLVWAARRIVSGRSRPEPTRGDADRMLSRYAVNVALLRGMAEAVGARSLFVWQPAMGYELLLNPLRVMNEKEFRMWVDVGRESDAWRHEAFLRTPPPGVVDLTAVFAGTREQVYMDPRHPNRYGTEVIAERLATLVREVMR